MSLTDVLLSFSDNGMLCDGCDYLDKGSCSVPVYLPFLWKIIFDFLGYSIFLYFKPFHLLQNMSHDINIISTQVEYIFELTFEF